MCHIILFLPLLGLALFLVLPLAIAGPLYAAITVLSVAMYWLIIKAMRRPVETGREGLLRSTGEITGRDAGHWLVSIGNEVWEADADETLAIGDKVRITDIDGLILRVQRADRTPAAIAQSH